MGERIGVRSKADADKIKLKGLHAMLASIPIAYETNGLGNKSQKRYFWKILDSIWRNEKKREENWYEKELAVIQPVKQEAFHLAGSSPKLDALIRQLALKCRCGAPVIYKK